MNTMVLAHGGHFVMFLIPVAAVVYLVIALRGDTPKRNNASTPALPRSALGRQMHSALRPPRTGRPTTPSTPPGGGDVTPLRFSPGARGGRRWVSKEGQKPR